MHKYVVDVLQSDLARKTVMIRAHYSKGLTLKKFVFDICVCMYVSLYICVWIVFVDET